MKKLIYLTLTIFVVTGLFACDSSSNENFMLKVTTPVTGGSVTIDPEKSNYAKGETVTLTAVPMEGYQFKEWGGPNGSEIDNNVIVMNNNKEVTAVFEEVLLSTYLHFSDTFQTGDTSHKENGCSWAESTNVSVEMSPNGTLGMKYVFGPDTYNEDSLSEQRFDLGGRYSELWIKYDLYIPSNFHHRCPVQLQLVNAESGMQVGDRIIRVKSDNSQQGYTIPDEEAWGVVFRIDGDEIWVDKLPDCFTLIDGDKFLNKRTNVISQVKKREGYVDNNKLLALWQGEYGSRVSGNMVAFTFNNYNRGDSSLGYFPATDAGAWRQSILTDTVLIDKEKNCGKWIEMMFHLKIAGPSNDNGILQVWKNGEKILNVTDLSNNSKLGYNYYEYGSLLGWANSGYTEETIMYIDNVFISTNKIVSGD